MANRLKERYVSEITPALVEKFNYKSVMQVPKIEKIILNMGVGDAITNAKNLDDAVNELTLISGQKPLITKAKKNQLLVSVYVKVCQLVQRLLYVVTVCMIF